MRLTERRRDKGRGGERERDSVKGRHAACGEEGEREEKTKSNCSKFMDRVAAMKTPRQQIQVNLGKVMAFNPHQSFLFSPFSRHGMLRLRCFALQAGVKELGFRKWCL